MKVSAGTLLYRAAGTGDPDPAWEVLLVHPSGAYNRRAPWSIPKGLPNPGEELEEAARRETREETGVEAGALRELGRVRYTRSKKEIVAFYGPAPAGAVAQCGSWEVDCAEFVSLERARTLLHPEQAPLVDRLLERLAPSGPR